MFDLPLVAGLTSTALFIGSYLPMLHKAWRTRDLSSYSRPSLLLTNVGNVVQTVYVISLPLGPVWILHGFYLAASALMLGLHLHHTPVTPDRPTVPDPHLAPEGHDDDSHLHDL